MTAKSWMERARMSSPCSVAALELPMAAICALLIGDKFDSPGRIEELHQSGVG